MSWAGIGMHRVAKTDCNPRSRILLWLSKDLDYSVATPNFNLWCIVASKHCPKKSKINPVWGKGEWYVTLNVNVPFKMVRGVISRVRGGSGGPGTPMFLIEQSEGSNSFLEEARGAWMEEGWEVEVLGEGRTVASESPWDRASEEVSRLDPQDTSKRLTQGFNLTSPTSNGWLEQEQVRRRIRAALALRRPRAEPDRGLLIQPHGSLARQLWPCWEQADSLLS